MKNRSKQPRTNPVAKAMAKHRQGGPHVPSRKLERQEAARRLRRGEW